jgi:DNA-binding IscR family transcriptional regulator
LCATREIWGEMKIAIDRVLVCTTLQDLAERQKNKEKVESMYYI